MGKPYKATLRILFSYVIVNSSLECNSAVNFRILSLHRCVFVKSLILNYYGKKQKTKFQILNAASQTMS